MAHRSKDGELRLHQFDDEGGSDDGLAGNSRTASPTTLLNESASPPAKPTGAQIDTIGQSLDGLPDQDVSIQVGNDDRGHDGHPSRPASDAG